MVPIRLTSAYRKICASAILLCGLLLYDWMAIRSYLAYQSNANSNFLAVFQRPTALDPIHAEYRMRIENYYSRQSRRIEPSIAVDICAQALQRNPFNAWNWLQLSTLYQTMGNAQAAECALHAATRLSPLSATMAIAAALFWLDQDKTPEAMHWLRRAIEYDASLAAEVFDLCWEMELNPADILKHVIPSQSSVMRDYISFLIQQDKVTEALDAWSAWIQQPRPFQANSAYKTVGALIDALIQRQSPEAAGTVWRQFLEHSLEKRYADGAESLLTNGGFETEPLNAGLDWRLVASPHARIRTDGEIHQAGWRSLAIRFDGQENLKFDHVYQLVPVVPNTRYHFSGFMRTENITSDQGPRFEIRDYYQPARLSLTTDGLVGSHDWTCQDLEFVTGPDTRLLTIYIKRPPSWHLASRIDGTVWIDDLKLVRSGRQ